jgi:hypothetical protein
MLRTPQLHYDFVRKGEGGAELQSTIRQWFDRMKTSELLGGETPLALEQLDGTTKMSHWMMCLYERFGQNTYVVGPKVQDLFRRTELSKITPEMVTPPTRAFYIGLVDCPWTIWGGERTKMHSITGVYVSFTKIAQIVDGKRSDPPVFHDCINLLLWGQANERSRDRYDDSVLWFSISLDRWVKGGQDLETFFQSHSVMTATQDDLKDYNPMAAELDPFAQAYLPGKPEDLATQRHALSSILRLVLNVCLYMDSEDPELEVRDNKDEAKKLRAEAAKKKSPGKRKKLDRRADNLPKTKFIYVGPMYEEIAERESREHQGGTHADPIEHGVPPHWQRYWVGSGAARKAVWKHKGMYRRGSGKPDRTITKIRE